MDDAGLSSVTRSLKVGHGDLIPSLICATIGGLIIGGTVALQRVWRHGLRCAKNVITICVTQYVVDLYKCQNKVIGGGRIRSNSLMSIPWKDLFLTLLVCISRFVR